MSLNITKIITETNSLLKERLGWKGLMDHPVFAPL